MLLGSTSKEREESRKDQRADDEAELRTEAAELRLGYTPWLRALSLAWVADQLS